MIELSIEKTQEKLKEITLQLKEALKEPFPSVKEITSFASNVIEAKKYCYDNIYDPSESGFYDVMQSVKNLKPKLSGNPTANEAREYANKLEIYEKLKENADQVSQLIRQFNSKVEDIEKEWIQESTGFKRIVPKKYQDKVWSLAWEYGHAYGYSEVENYLNDLVEIF